MKQLQKRLHKKIENGRWTSKSKLMEGKIKIVVRCLVNKTKSSLGRNFFLFFPRMQNRLKTEETDERRPKRE